MKNHGPLINEGQRLKVNYRYDFVEMEIQAYNVEQRHCSQEMSDESRSN